MRFSSFSRYICMHTCACAFERSLCVHMTHTQMYACPIACVRTHTYAIYIYIYIYIYIHIYTRIDWNQERVFTEHSFSNAHMCMYKCKFMHVYSLCANIRMHMWVHKYKTVPCVLQKHACMLERIYVYMRMYIYVLLYACQIHMNTPSHICIYACASSPHATFFVHMCTLCVCVCVCIKYNYIHT